MTRVDRNRLVQPVRRWKVRSRNVVSKGALQTSAYKEKILVCIPSGDVISVVIRTANR